MGLTRCAIWVTFVGFVSFDILAYFIVTIMHRCCSFGITCLYLEEIIAAFGNQVYIIGGDGTLKGAAVIYEVISYVILENLFFLAVYT